MKENRLLLARVEKENDMVESTKIKKELHNPYKDAFSGIECFKCTFSLKFKEGAKPHQAPPRACGICFTNTIQKGVRVSTRTEINHPSRVDKTDE